jgi:hypothetical protein
VYAGITVKLTVSSIRSVAGRLALRTGLKKP